MLMKKARAVVLALLAVALILSSTIAAVAQTATPTPPPEDTPEVTEAPAPQETATAEAVPTSEEPSTDAITATVTLTPTMEITTTATVTATAAITDTAAITTTEEVTATAAVAAAAITALPAITQTVVVTQSDALELTVYNQNVGLVSEVRSLPLVAGLNEVRYTNIPPALDPATAFMLPLSATAGIQVIEQYFEYDAPDAAALLARYVGQDISVTTAQGTSHTGTLLSVRDNVVLNTPQGVQILRLEHVQAISLPPLPGDFVAEPTLVWLVNAETDEPQPVRVTYLTSGLEWRADYVAILSADETSLSLDGRFAIQNNSGIDYTDARLKLVAGTINQVAPPPIMRPVPELAERDSGAVATQERGLFEYHLYEVQHLVTLANQQTKQIGFAAAPQISVTKTLVFDASPSLFVGYGRGIIEPGYGIQQDVPVQARLEVANTITDGLGIPLPQGTVRVYQQDIDGSPQLIGEDAIAHTATDEQLSLSIGDVFDVVGERTQVGFEQLGERSVEETIQITLRNHKAEAVTVRVIEHLFRAQDAEVIESTPDYTLIDANTIEYELTIEPGEEATAQYTVRYTW
ncbi:MAG: DUF4139 domain-containing protein [Chloroflexi bacterium]|jgi:hypothetical protein|nr:DUF4139 domain-containing protein [Chloroflexota bacterium]